MNDAKQFWNWTQRVVVPNLYTEVDYRGHALPDGGSRVISTMAAYRVGPVRLRQHRVIHGKQISEGFFVLLSSSKLIPVEGGDVAQLVEHRIGTPPTQVRFAGAAGDFSPRVNFLCSLLRCPHTSVRNRVH